MPFGFYQHDETKISTDVLQSILNGIDAYIYVSDPETDEILFINDKMSQHYDIKGNSVGKVCWQVLQSDFTERCAFCPNYKLEKEPDSVVVWEEHSTVTGRYYRNTDCLIKWVGDKLVHLQHSVDITDIRMAEVALQKRLEQQELMAGIAQSFISTDDTSTLIRNALQMAGEFMDVSRIALAKVEIESDALSFSYSWCNPGYDLTSLEDKQLSLHDFYPFYNAFINKKASCTGYGDISGMRELAGLSKAGVQALLTVPVYVAGKFWGVLSFDECRHTRVWSESDIQFIKLIGSIISGVLTRSITEEELARMSSIVNSSPQYVSYINKEGGFEYFNKGALNIVGYTAEEFLQGGLSLIFSPEVNMEIHEKHIPKVLQEGWADFELPVLRKDGQERILFFSTFKTKSKDLGIGAIASDITEKRRLEKELLSAKEQAEQSSRSKGEFLSRMSHEMRTPMNAIIGMTHIAKASSDPEKKEYCLDKIGDASNHLLGVINDILDMSKIEANKFELSYTEFVFEKMLMHVFNVITFRVDEKKQNLVLRVDDNFPYAIISDEQRLAQVLTNLLSNAVKFTPEHGSITVLASKMDEKDGVCVLRISVKDSGIGISPAQQGKLFRSFEQADGGIARKFGGTGLGLAISKNIVELMGGEIWVESELGAGSEFIFNIKAQKGDSYHSSTQEYKGGWKNLRILVVDDAPEVREYFAHFAQGAGIYCDVAENGTEACCLIDENYENPYHIVFADWRMPGMNGIELTSRIKDKFGTDIVVIMISAAEWSDIEPDAKKAGVDYFVPKPLFASQLVDCINECLGTKQQITKALPTATCSTGCFAGYRILLVEDIEINREIVISLLEHTGLEVDCAENGREALDMFERNQDVYDMIFMDIHMPEVDGYEATLGIRALDIPFARSIPIVAMTANVFREDIEKCLSVGMTDHVGKPLNIEDVIAKLKKYLPAEPASVN